MVGDSERDLIAGKDAGCKTILALSGKLSRSDIENLACRPDFIAGDLAQAADIVIDLAR
ncbi:MAG: HAD hydrolase-like protein [Armatimonadetes bacterium]|nr:HAD hydrolase-like protein [Armatimonadota bacterium]